MALTLYYHPLSSYCIKALVALYELGTPFDKRFIDLGDAADRAALQALWTLRKFPVLHDRARDQAWPESSILIEYVDRHYPGPARLLPADPDLALTVRLWDRVFDLQVQTPMQSIVADRLFGLGGHTQPARDALAAAYGVIDAQLAAGTGPWVCGAAFTLADCAAAPALFYAPTLVPCSEAHRRLRAYAERLMARPSVARALAEARPYFHLYPFRENLPAQYQPGQTANTP